MGCLVWFVVAFLGGLIGEGIIGSGGNQASFVSVMTITTITSIVIAIWYGNRVSRKNKAVQK